MFRFHFILKNVLFWWSIGKLCEAGTIYGWLHSHQKSCQPHTIYNLHSISAVNCGRVTRFLCNSTAQKSCQGGRILFSWVAQKIVSPPWFMIILHISCDPHTIFVGIPSLHILNFHRPVSFSTIQCHFPAKVLYVFFQKFEWDGREILHSCSP